VVEEEKGKGPLERGAQNGRWVLSTAAASEGQITRAVEGEAKRPGRGGIVSKSSSPKMLEPGHPFQRKKKRGGSRKCSWTLQWPTPVH